MKVASKINNFLDEDIENEETTQATFLVYIETEMYSFQTIDEVVNQIKADAYFEVGEDDLITNLEGLEKNETLGIAEDVLVKRWL